MKRFLVALSLIAGMVPPVYFGGSGGCASGVIGPLIVVLSGSSGGGGVKSVPPGIICGTDCEESFPKGTSVTLTATANPGFLFTGWSGGGCSGTDPCTLTLNNPTSVTADFNTAAQVSLTVTGAGEGSVTADAGNLDCDKTGGTCTAAVAAGAEVTLTALPDTGFVLHRWNGADCPFGRTCTLTIDADTALEVSFVPILYHSNRVLDGSNAILPNTSFYNVWTTTTDGLNQLALTPFTQTRSFSPAFSPDGNQVAYNSDRSLTDLDAEAPLAGPDNIWIENADGSGGDLAVTGMTAFGASSAMPQWTPDGLKIAYLSRRSLTDLSDPAAPANNVPNLWISDADGTDPLALTQLTQFSTSVSWLQISPDGGEIVFVSSMNLSENPADPGVGENVWLMNIDATGLTALTQFTDVNMRNEKPVWSLDGSKIAWHSRASPTDPNPDAAPIGNANIWIMNADGSDPMPLTQKVQPGLDSGNPTWFPDGSFLVFVSQLNVTDPVNGPSTALNLWRINPDGSGLEPLTSAQTNIEEIFLPPDGSLVFFDSALDSADPSGGTVDPNGSFNVFRIGLDGSDPLALTKISATQAASRLPNGPSN